jgi:S-adenosylmethionine hydrolase
MPGRRFDTLTFLSDFGLVDEFVGVVKAVVRDLAPHVTVIDLTHEVAPHDIRGGALTLARAVQYLPEGVVLAVVDPGVGSDRKAVAVEVAGGAGILVGPDNGLLGPAVAMVGGAERAVVLSNEAYHLPHTSATFHGRDVFAPVVAHLCNGVPLEELGETIDPGELVPGVVPIAREEGGGLACEALWVDRFGNVQLNVGPDDIVAWGGRVAIAWRDATGSEVVRTAVVAPSYDRIGGGVGLVVDSSGLLALCLPRRSAAAELGLAAGDAVALRPLDETLGPSGTTVQLTPRR